MNKDICNQYRVKVWIAEKQFSLFPTIYTIDVANGFIEFSWKGEVYHVRLENVSQEMPVSED